MSLSEWAELGAGIATAVGGGYLIWLAFSKGFQRIRAGMNARKQKEDMSMDRSIHEQLSELRHDSQACRTKLFQYHNGSSFANGNSMKKMSMTHESCHPGMVPTFRGTSDQMLSLFVDMLELAHKDTPVLVEVNRMPDSYFKSYLQSNHVLMFSVLPIKNVKENEIGCIICEWCAWAFIDSIEEKRFSDKFSTIRNTVQYLLSTEKRSRRYG